MDEDSNVLSYDNYAARQRLIDHAHRVDEHENKKRDEQHQHSDLDDADAFGIAMIYSGCVVLAIVGIICAWYY